MRKLLATAAALALLASGTPAIAQQTDSIETHQQRIGPPVTKFGGAATLTVRLLDRQGAAPKRGMGHAVNLATGDGDFLTFDASGTAVIQLEPGAYDINAMALSGDELTAVSRRDVVLNDIAEVTLDARPAKPVTVKVDRPGAKLLDSAVSVSTLVAGTGFASTLFTGPDVKTFAVPNTPVSSRRNVFVYRPTLGGADYRYHLVHVSDGSLPNGPVYHTPDRRLARFDTTYYGQGLAATGLEGNNGKPAALPGLSIFRYVDLPIPTKRTEYYTADPSVTWFNLRMLGDDAAYTNAALRPGTNQSTWFRAPVGVAWGNGITRTGNDLTIDVQPFAPSDDKRYVGDFGAGGEGKTVLLKDGVEIGTSETVGQGSFTLPPEKATYTLRTSGTRVASDSNLDSTVVAEWTFTSATGDAKIPVSLVRLGIGRDRSGKPAQNDLGQVRAGSNHELTLVAEQQPGSAAAPVGIPSLEVSYDEGKTWRRQFVGWGGQRGNAWLVEPAQPGFVSLRVSATASDGTKFTQTVLRAYELIG